MRWTFNSPDLELSAQLSIEAALPPLIAQLLVARGVRTAAEAHAFLHPEISQLHSPYLMRGMKLVVERVQRAIANQERMLIYGDYDVDGTVAIVILKTAIELCGGRADFHVPHRIRDGYGMKDDIENSIAAGFSRHITKPVDWQELKVAIQKIAGEALHSEAQPAAGLSWTDAEYATKTNRES